MQNYADLLAIEDAASKIIYDSRSEPNVKELDTYNSGFFFEKPKKSKYMVTYAPVYNIKTSDYRSNAEKENEEPLKKRKKYNVCIIS